ncbi:MAG: 30S ribosomal protein S17 [Myxococcales bacterium]|nr:30S ribosomal protein S17 [Myxococcales bacterium]
MSEAQTQTQTAPETGTHERGKRRVLQGVIRSDKMDKTVVVEVTQRVKHRTYAKFVLRKTRYKAHDERNEYRTGDTVRIVEDRPRSKDKRWRVQQLVERPK